jgi:hypothetical protein
LKAELSQKSAIYSARHPEIVRLTAQVKAMEESARSTPSSDAKRSGNIAEGLDNLLYQRELIQKSLEGANQKLSTARLGESLERNQFAERLEVLEQAVVPQKPIKPDRRKLVAFALLAAIIAGFGGVFAIEAMDRTIRGGPDLVGVVAGNTIVTIPYIATNEELLQARGRVKIVAGVSALIVLAALAFAHVFVRPLDELWFTLLSRLSSVWSAF